MTGHLNKEFKRIRSPYCERCYGKVRDFSGLTDFDSSLPCRLNFWKWDHVPFQVLDQLVTCHIWLYLGITGFVFKDTENTESDWITLSLLVRSVLFSFHARSVLFLLFIKHNSWWTMKLLPAIATDKDKNQCSTTNFFALPHYTLLGKSWDFDKQQCCFWVWQICDTALDSLGHCTWKFNDSINFRCCLSADQINLSQSSTTSIGTLQAFPYQLVFFFLSLLIYFFIFKLLLTSTAEKEGSCVQAQVTKMICC